MTKQLCGKKVVIADFRRAAEIIMKDIDIQRDKLRALVSEYSDVLQSVDEAYDDFDVALDKLSELL